PPPEPPPPPPPPPYIADFTADGAVVGTFDHLRVTFDKPIRADDFDVSDVYLDGPNGDFLGYAQDVTVVPGSNNRVFDVRYEPQTKFGTYLLFIGPSITDPYGQLLDQNKNGYGGEYWVDTLHADIVVSNQATYVAPAVPRRVPEGGVLASSLLVNADGTIQDLNVSVSV